MDHGPDAKGIIAVTQLLNNSPLRKNYPFGLVFLLSCIFEKCRHDHKSMLNGQAFMQLQWALKKFDDLTPRELYNILRLRSEVFVVEQNCVFLDMDNKDQDCFHLMGYHDNELVAYVRIVPPGLAYDEMSIGRVVSSPMYRGTGAGRQLMIKAISTAIELFGKQPIRIGAQLYLKNFYSSLGFEPQGDIYIEDGIPHIIMLKP